MLLTCEHGGNLIPRELASRFAGKDRLLHSHRGWDPGALELAGTIAATLQVPLRFALISRLVVDLNRSVDHPSLFSKWSLPRSAAEHRDVLKKHYQPYRREVETVIQSLSRHKPLLHVSVHSFTPVLRGQRRRTDIGLLFDPSRLFECRVVAAWIRTLREEFPQLRIDRNRPYRGIDDGLTTALRARLPDHRYAGIELEVNQRLVRRGAPSWPGTMQAVARSLASALVVFSGADA